MLNETTEIVLKACWTMFSQVNGNPDLHMSATRFCIALFFLTLLYITIRMRTMAQYKPHRVIAMVGCVLMMVRESSMLVSVSGYELGLFSDKVIYLLWPSIERGFELASFACFSWYTVEASQWETLRKLARKTWVALVIGIFLFSVYTVIEWKEFFNPNVVHTIYAGKYSPLDWQAHAIMALTATVGIAAAYMRRRGSTYLLWFWIITYLEHVAKIVLLVTASEVAWQSTILHAMHTWSIPLMLLHFINAYVLKMSQCAICQNEVFLGRAYWESMHADYTEINK